MAPEDARDNKASFMLQTKSMVFAVSNASKRSFFTGQIMLRIFAAAFTLAAICTMVTSSQTISVFGFTIRAHYSDSSSMKFLLAADATICAFSVLSLIYVYHLRRSGSNIKSCFYLFLHDMVIMVLAISGCAAATAVGFISKYGQAKSGWMAICDHVAKFCNEMMIAMVLSYLAFFSYFALAIMSTNKIMYQAN